MTKEELKEHCKRQIQQFERIEKIMPVTPNDWKRYEEHKLILELLDQEPILEKINKMKYEIADSLEFWDYSPNNNPLARDILETVTHYWGDIKAESEDKK